MKAKKKFKNYEGKNMDATATFKMSQKRQESTVTTVATQTRKTTLWYKANSASLKPSPIKQTKTKKKIIVAAWNKINVSNVVSNINLIILANCIRYNYDFSCHLSVDFCFFFFDHLFQDEFCFSPYFYGYRWDYIFFFLFLCLLLLL